MIGEVDLENSIVQIGDLQNVIAVTVECDRKIQILKEKAETARQSAEEAEKEKTDLFHRKKALKALQVAVGVHADALESVIECNDEILNNQKKMFQGMKILLGIGVMNIAANRTVVRELELKMKNASKEELSEFARKEMMSVVMQLKAQQDIMSRVEKHGEELNNYGNKLKESGEKITDINSNINSFKEECANTLKSVEKVKESNAIIEKDIKDKISELDNKFANLKEETIRSAEDIIDKKVTGSVNNMTEKFNAAIEQFKNDFESLKTKEAESSKNIAVLQDKARGQQEKIEKEIDNVSQRFDAFKNETEQNLNEKFENLNVTLQSKIYEEHIKSLEERVAVLSKKSFFDTMFYKILIGAISVGALVLALLK